MGRLPLHFVSMRGVYLWSFRATPVRHANGYFSRYLPAVLALQVLVSHCIYYSLPALLNAY